MKKYFIGSLVAIIVLGVCIAQAQNRGQARKKVIFKGKTYLSGGQFGNGKISKKMFDSLIGYGLVARDTAGVPHPVVLFTFAYAERGVYEDSTGRSSIMTDYYSIESDNGKIPADWVKQLKARSKAGDTATFTEILASYQDSVRTRFHAEPLKLIITD